MNKLGFGFLRFLPTIPGDEKSFDREQVCHMVDYFLEHGGRYFDTGYNYLDGESEIAIRETVVKRHPRSEIEIADKLPTWLIQTKEDCPRYFQEQLERCGVDYFDRYLIHGIGKKHYDTCAKCGVFSFLAELKKSGKAKKIGFSFHDEADFLDRILTEYPFFDFVQLQINYLDWTSPSIQSQLCYEVAVKHNKPVVVMEPVKGGTLANLPEEAEKILRTIHPEESPATWAIRFAQTLPGVCTVLSGMNSMDQLIDNMRDLPPLNDVEQNALAQVRQIVQSSIAVACTGCRYCVDDCPMHIAIPDYFKLYNEYSRTPADQWYIQPVYDRIAEKHGKASACIGCKQCESRCPQFLKITDYLSRVREIFEKE